MFAKKIITFLVLLLVVQFLSGCRASTPYDLTPFNGFGPNGQSLRSYRMEERSAPTSLVLTPQNTPSSEY